MERAEVKPVRIQRQRTKGWRMPENTVYVGRPTRWGNPFTFANDGPLALEYFRDLCTGVFSTSMRDNTMRAYRRAEARIYGAAPATLTLAEQAAIFLRGKNLACWCPLDQPCHADVLLELANQEAR